MVGFSQSFNCFYILQIFTSPSHVVDIAGPVILDPSTPPTPESPTEQKKSEVDLLKV